MLDIAVLKADHIGETPIVQKFAVNQDDDLLGVVGPVEGKKP